MTHSIDSPTPRTPLVGWIPVRLVCYGAAIAATAVVATVLTRLLVPAAPSPWHQLVLIKNALLPIALFAVYGGLTRLMEHRPASEIDIRVGFPAFLVGGLIGTALMGAFFLALWGLGFSHTTPGTGIDGLTNELLAPLVTAMGEELLFRVVLLRLVEEMTGTTVAIVLSAALFGLSHAVNPGASPLAVAMLTAGLGALLALAYILTRNVWLAVGIHMSWNFAEGYLFGAPDSGLRDPHSVVLTTLSGPSLITGGDFGPEASILLLALTLIATAVLFALVRRHGGWTPFRLHLRSPAA